MSVKEEKNCTLCLNIAENGFEAIDEITREMFDVLSIKMNFDVTKDPILCQDCAEVIKKSYYFKSACSDTEQLILSFTYGEKEDKFAMEDIYQHIKNIEAVVSQDFNICRFCMSKWDINALVPLDSLLSEPSYAKMLPVFLPQMDLNIIKDPVICTLCKENLECYFKFVDLYLDLENKSNKFTQISDTIKQEADILEDTKNVDSKIHDNLLKTEEAFNIKDEKLNLDINSCESPPKIRVDQNTDMYPDEKINQHMQSAIISTETGIYQCETCSYETKVEKHIKTHMLSHSTQMKIYTCTICVFNTKYKRNLKKHMLVHKNDSEVVIHKCTKCTYNTKYKDNLKSHLLVHKDAWDVDMHKCTMCGYKTKSKRYLRAHMLIHKDKSEMEMYKCALCTYETKLKDCLKSHMLIHKDTTAVYLHKCTTCNYETKYKANLNCHMLIHKDRSEIKMYKCATCTYETKYKSNLKCHMRIHKNAPKYKCAICTYESIYEGVIKEHVLAHRDVS